MWKSGCLRLKWCAHLISCFVARRIAVGVEGHVRRDGMTRDEAWEGTDLSEEAHFVNLSDHSVQNLSFKRLEDDGFVLNRVNDEVLSRLNEACTDVVDGGDGDDETIFARTGALYLAEQLLLDCVQQLRPWTLKTKKFITPSPRKNE